MSQRALRRYPALAGFGALAVMALLLPSTLNVPQTGPTTLAEFAPVPGKTMSNIANLTELAPTSSDGIGSGGSGVTAGAGGTSPATTIALRASTAGTRRAGTKHCVGNPPRQTEDPLSPPCIAFFDGDNGGATAKGVTADEIRVVFILTCSSGTRPNVKDYDTASDAFGALVRYFNERFQTYGRRVHTWWYEKPCGPEASQRALIQEINERIDPFAIINLGAPVAMADEAGRLGIWTNLNGGRRAEMSQRAPFLRSFAPDKEDWMANAAAMLCAKFAGRPARYSGEPTAQSQTRKFAVNYSSLADPTRQGLPVFTEEVSARCGETAGEILETSGADASIDLARWRSAGVTTIIDIGETLYFAVGAENQGWLPEWLYVPDYFNNAAYRLVYPPAEMAHTFAVTPARRLAERVEDNEIYQASRAACPDCTRPVDGVTYHETLLFFIGIQAAGPRLTVASVDRGLHAIPQRPSLNPWTPAAYFAPGNWTFVKDAMLARWDAAGTPSGAPSGASPGCWRLAEEGKRYRAQDWMLNPADDGFDRFGVWPCQGEG